MKNLFFPLYLIAGLLLNTTLVHAADKFKVCADPLNPPYSSKNKDGYENKIAELFAKKLGQELEYTWLPQRIGFIRNTLKAEIEGTDQFKCDVVMGVAAGDDLTLNTIPYYHSQYVMLIAKGRGWDDITIPEQLGSLPLDKQEKLKIAMFDRGPGTDWLQQTNLLEQGVPYQSMSGDEKNNAAMTIAQDLRDKKIDIAILWGPMAAYVLSQSPKDSFIVLPMATRPNLKFDFSMAMGVRQSDGKRKAVLDKLITENKAEIEAILKSYQVPLLPIPESKPRKDD
jgi:quinoprotein dehydrogenase-associated probable ABC transporter substrate-binding protein